MNVVPDRRSFTCDLEDQGATKAKKSWTLQPLRNAWDNITSRKIKVGPHDAVSDFLLDLKRVAEKLFPQWESSLKAHIDATDLEFLSKRQLFEDHDLFMYFFCGLVAIEGIKVRTLFDYGLASELESEINEQIDGALGLERRDAADLVFDMLRTVKRAEVEDLVKPHDQIMKWIVRLMGLDKVPETKDLMADIIFCQETAAPFALAQLHWWLTYKASHRMIQSKTA